MACGKNVSKLTKNAPKMYVMGKKYPKNELLFINNTIVRLSNITQISPKYLHIPIVLLFLIFQ